MEKKNFLEKLGFTGSLFTYSKTYPLYNYTITVDIQEEKISYRTDNKITSDRQDDGQIQLGDHTTSNFSANENYVVLECVDRLLDKGYAPNDIHLERRWQIGRGAAGGKADINVYGRDGRTLMIIECKTWDEEFEKEKNKMEEHGGQLFTYLNQDKNSQYLVLYTSKFENDEIHYENLIVQVKDRKEDLEKSPIQIDLENIKLYRDAKNKTELYEVWKESFNKYFHFNGIFDSDAIAYSLSLKALKKKNLKKLDDSKGLFNKFAEILRHNNISDNANAFNRVLSLFLCKIVDEEKKDEDDVLDFQVREDEEYEHIIDRLQALYQKGMAKLKEEIVYYTDEYIMDIIRLYPKQTPIEKVEEIFKDLKYYTNNEFAFKEVHNRKLFEQNARVLVEVIKLIQNYQFRFTSKQQVLGDFFELMLNHGVKQSEGQFFTPIPIVRYIILSLGFENMINEKLEKGDTGFLPKILDYACGAGHFLTESIEELQQVLKRIDETKYIDELSKKIIHYREGTEWAADYVFGIEKDYRLARTSQIACYINGDGDANIIFGDGLEEHDRLNLDNKKFDIVITNPPYSVEAFRNYLNVGKTHFELFEYLTERSKEIEVLFIERTKQVLADAGVAGIILPSSILSNSGLYTKAREILLKHFEIVGITELGSKTFIATGTTTVILFLKRRNDDFLKDRNYITSDYFNNTQYQINYRYIDAERFLKMFTEHRNFDLSDYKLFLKSEINERLSNTEMFKDYRNSFDSSTEIKQLQTKSYFINYSKEEKEREMSKRFYDYCKVKEKEKFLYFMLCLGDGNKNLDTMNNYYKYQHSVIIKTGKEIDEQKEYLGYEFVGRKGNEGIKINQNGGKMFDDSNYENPEKANYYILNAFMRNTISKVHESQQKNINVYKLVDLIDFNRVDFEKIIKLNSDKKIEIQSKWDFIKLEKLLAVLESGNRPTGGVGAISSGIPSLGGEHIGKDGKLFLETIKYVPLDYYENANRGILQPNDVLICKDGALTGKVAIMPRPMPFEKAMINEHVFRLVANDLIVQKYLFAYLYSVYGQILLKSNITGQAQGGINSSNLLNIQIPVPPIDIQQKIVTKIEMIENVENENLNKIEKLENEIENLMLISNKSLNGRFEDFATLEYGSGLPEKNRVKGEYPVLGSNGIVGYHNEFFIKGPAIIVGRKGSAGKVTYQEMDCYPIDTAFYIKMKDERVPLKFFYYYIKSLNLEKHAAGVGVPGLNRNDVHNLLIQLPSYEEQEKLVATIQEKEIEIEKLKLALLTVDAEKEEVLKKYL